MGHQALRLFGARFPSAREPRQDREEYRQLVPEVRTGRAMRLNLEPPLHDLEHLPRPSERARTSNQRPGDAPKRRRPNPRSQSGHPIFRRNRQGVAELTAREPRWAGSTPCNCIWPKQSWWRSDWGRTRILSQRTFQPIARGATCLPQPGRTSSCQRALGLPVLAAAPVAGGETQRECKELL
jgi:hypothetical protein